MTAPIVLRPRRSGIVLPSRSIPLKPGGSSIAPGIAPGPDTVKLDPYLYPPPFSTPINVSGNVGLVGVGARFTPTAFPFTLPVSCYGVISTIDLLLDGIVPTTNVLWTFLINDIPIPGFSPLTILGRSGAASVSKTWQGPLRLQLPLGAQFSVTIQDVDGAVYTAGTSVYGWFWPQQR